MDKDCDVVRDLLPLYVDGACSEASRALVEEHVNACPACADMLAKLRNSACEDSLRQEAAAVMAPRKWRNRAFAASCALAGFLCVPACLLAAMAPGQGMGGGMWMLLLAPSLLVETSVTLLPLRSRRYTGRWTLLGFTASLLLLLTACAVYTQRWYFALCALGLYAASAVFLAPWAVRELPLRGVLGRKKWLAIVLWDGGFALLLGLGWCLMGTASRPWTAWLGIGGLAALLGAAVFVLARKLPMDRLVRLGLCVTVAGNAPGWLYRPFLQLTGAAGTGAGRTVCAVLLAAATAAGAALALTGAWQAWRRSVNRNG